MPWARFLFKKQQKVYARVDLAGELVKDGPLVEIRYQLEGKSYRAQPANLSPHPEGPGPLLPDPTDGPAATAAPAPPPVPPTTNGEAHDSVVSVRPASPKEEETQKPKDKHPPTPADTVVIYADGACSGNPGPAGLGVYLRYQHEVKEISEYLGQGTNNIAELMAIKRALENCPDKSLKIEIYTDSAYSIGVLTQGWKAKANQELISEIRSMMRHFPRLKFIKVAGHAGIFGNERADELARQAITSR